MSTIRSATISSWLVAAALAVSLFAAPLIAHAGGYEDCMDSCMNDGNSSEGCHEICK